MKHNLLYILPFLLVFAAGCSLNKSNNPAPVNIPEGTFTGQFKFQRNLKAHVDSGHANLTLNMETATGFHVTGDTATVHAGSYGGYVIYTSLGEIAFGDKTFPTTGTPAKYHLSGVYYYTYDGSNLQISYKSYADTLAFLYTMKKTGN